MNQRAAIAARPRAANTAISLPSVPMLRLFGCWLIGVSALAVFVAVRLSGGSPNPLNHLGYLPVVLAAYLFGLRGGLVAATYVGFVLGPLATMAGLEGNVEGVAVSAFRSGMLILCGVLSGLLFDRGRASVRELQAAAASLADRQREGMVALARGAEAKDMDTGDHVVRVQLISEQLGRATGMNEDAAASIGWSAMLHDIGKLHVPDRILLKPGPLTKDEWEIMRLHPIWGAEILAQGDGFEIARRIARWHHENIDGSGYPDGLRGEAIPLEARIVRIADAFDAMTHGRPYQAARPRDRALEELRRCAGSQFDPELVELFTAMLQGNPAMADRLHRLDQAGLSGRFLAGTHPPPGPFSRVSGSEGLR